MPARRRARLRNHRLHDQAARVRIDHAEPAQGEQGQRLHPCAHAAGPAAAGASGPISPSISAPISADAASAASWSGR